MFSSRSFHFHLYFRAFREMGKKVIYVTNNSTKSRQEYVQKFEELGFGGNFVRISNTVSLKMTIISLKPYERALNLSFIKD